MLSELFRLFSDTKQVHIKVECKKKKDKNGKICTFLCTTLRVVHFSGGVLLCTAPLELSLLGQKYVCDTGDEAVSTFKKKIKLVYTNI